MNPNGQQVKAAFQRLMAVDPASTRFAGAALAGSSIPLVGAMVDDQEENLLNLLGAGVIMTGGQTAGSMIGMRQAHMSPDEQEAYIRKEVNSIKNKAAEMGDPIKGADYYGHEKQKVVDDFEPFMRGAPEGHILSKPKREIRGMYRGQMLGTLAAALPAYLALRGGDIEN